MSDIFGGSKQQSQSNSSNQAFPYLQGALSPIVGAGGQASSQLANMLGLNGAAGQNQGFDNWRNSTGYQFGLNQGMGAITGGAATKGLLNSGSTAKALNTFGQNFANTQYQNYLNPLQNLLGSGINAAGTIGSAGNVSSSTSSGSSTNGAGGTIGALLAK